MANQIETNLFEELSDADLMTVVGGTSTTDEVGNLTERTVGTGIPNLLITISPFSTTGRIAGNTVRGIDG